jgi:hypothetical protein
MATHFMPIRMAIRAKPICANYGTSPRWGCKHARQAAAPSHERASNNDLYTQDRRQPPTIATRRCSARDYERITHKVGAVAWDEMRRYAGHLDGLLHP